MKAKDIPKQYLKRIRYVRGDGYKLVNTDGTLTPETYYSKVGAYTSLVGRF